MKEKGFTLIELLAVIVILAIIALIATPIILGIINDAREESNERSVELYASAVKNGIAAYQLREGKEVLPGTYNEINKLPFIVDYDGNVECTEIIISEDSKVSLKGCTVNGGTKEYSYGTKQGNDEPSCTLDDKDDDGEASLSDVVTCETESFYVMSNENNKITMLSMFNLNLGILCEYNDSGEMVCTESDGSKIIQEENNRDALMFSSTNYWSSTTSSYPAYIYNSNENNIYSYLNEYETYLKKDLKVSSASASLISYEQLINLGCDPSVYNCSPDSVCGGPAANPAPSWVWGMSYWTGTAADNSNIRIVGYRGAFIPQGYASIQDEEGGGLIGVRPVITISTSDIQ